MKAFELAIQGMSCAHCVRAVTGALTGVKGVRVDSVSIGNASGEFDPAQTSAAQIAAAVQLAGYEATLAGQSS